MPDDEIETTGRPRRHTMRNTLSLSLSRSLFLAATFLGHCHALIKIRFVQIN